MAFVAAYGTTLQKRTRTGSAAPPPLPLTAPRNLRGVAGDDRITWAWSSPLSWGDDSAGAGTRRYGYQVRVPGQAWPVAVQATTAISIVTSGLAQGDQRQIRVRAENRLGETSGWVLSAAVAAGPTGNFLRWGAATFIDWGSDSRISYRA